MASLTRAQLAEAKSVDGSKPTQSLVCYDAAPRGTRGASASLGLLPTLNMARVYASDGTSLKGRSRSSLFLLATPLAQQLGVATEARMGELLDEGGKQEMEATGAAAAKKLLGAQYFLGEVLDLFRVHLKEIGDNVILPSSALRGKAPSGGGSAGGTGESPALPE